MNKPKFGVYLSPTGRLKVFSETKKHWLLDEGRVQRFPFFRGKAPVVKQMSKGWPMFFSRSDLKDHEHLGDL